MSNLTHLQNGNTKVNFLSGVLEKFMLDPDPDPKPTEK